VNQLPQDDGILLVGGLPPYRVRKVRYFLDPRFKGRDALPPPDRPEEQAREMVGLVANDWDGVGVAPPPLSEPSSPGISLPEIGMASDGPPASDGVPARTDRTATSQAPAHKEAAGALAEDVSEPFFAAQRPSSRAAQEADAPDSPAAEKEIPL
jgi:type IV secretory pathway TraG/TraD family ATPase VirD4